MTYEVVLEADTFMEENLADILCSGLQRVIDYPKGCTGSVAHTRCTVTRNTSSLPVVQQSTWAVMLPRLSELAERTDEPEDIGEAFGQSSFYVVPKHGDVPPHTGFTHERPQREITTVAKGC